MKLLLTSSGISNVSIHNALVNLLGKAVNESNALFVPTAIYPFPNGSYMAYEALSGKKGAPLCELGWKSLGVLELTTLSNIDKKIWIKTLQQTDALLVWGGDVLYLSYWMQQSGLAEMLPELLQKTVYVGVSAGSMATTSIFAETYYNKPGGACNIISSNNIKFNTPEGEIESNIIIGNGMGLVDFAIIPHFNHPHHQDASGTNAEIWAAQLSVPVYAIDDNTAIKVVGSNVEVISEGEWKLFNKQ